MQAMGHKSFHPLVFKLTTYARSNVRQLLSLYSQFYKVIMLESTNATGEGKINK
jgi:hypothetical protein